VFYYRFFLFSRLVDGDDYIEFSVRAYLYTILVWGGGEEEEGGSTAAPATKCMCDKNNDSKKPVQLPPRPLVIGGRSAIVTIDLRPEARYHY